VCFNTMLHACAQKGDSYTAEVWFRKLRSMGFEPNKISFNSLLNASVKQGNIPQVQHWLEMMVCSGIHPDGVTFWTLARAFSPPGVDVDSRTGDSQVLACSAIIEAYSKAGDLDGARYWVDQRTRARRDGGTTLESPVDPTPSDARQPTRAREPSQYVARPWLGAPEVALPEPCADACADSYAAGAVAGCYPGAPSQPPAPPAAWL